MDTSEVKKIAYLARMQLSDDELRRFASDLSDIIAFVRQLEAADLSGLEPLAHPLDAEQRLRADEVTEDDRRETLQSTAPETRDGFYLVPKVIE